jgi:hypothetical protein
VGKNERIFRKRELDLNLERSSGKNVGEGQEREKEK